MAGGPIGQNTGTSSGTGMPPGMAQASRDLAAIQQAQTQAASGFTPMGVPQTQSGFGPAVDNFSGLLAGLDDRNYGTGINPTLLDTFNPKVPLPQTQGGLGQTPNPFRSVLPIFTQSGQANAVFDPSSDPRIALANKQQFNALKRQQQYVTDPMQELYKQNFVNRYMNGNMGRDMRGMPTGMTFQQMPITVGDRTRSNYYQANPLTGMAGTGMAGLGIAGLLR